MRSLFAFQLITYIVVTEFTETRSTGDTNRNSTVLAPGATPNAIGEELGVVSPLVRSSANFNKNTRF